MTTPHLTPTTDPAFWRAAAFRGSGLDCILITGPPGMSADVEWLQALIAAHSDWRPRPAIPVPAGRGAHVRLEDGSEWTHVGSKNRPWRRFDADGRSCAWRSGDAIAGHIAEVYYAGREES